jgi:MFS transporter, SP family, general alpha glucoside:H+ symporter
MDEPKIVPTGRELNELDLTNPATADLIRQAEESDASDRKLGIWQAVKKYKKAVAWAMILSTSLIMEGYDSECHQLAVSQGIALRNPSYYMD